MNLASRIRTLTAILSTAVLLGMASCERSVPEEPKDPLMPTLPMAQGDMTLLFYVVASNNLASSWVQDLDEIKIGATRAGISEHSVRIVTYVVTPDEEQASLSLLVDDGVSMEPKLIRQYDRDICSTDPTRIREVIEDVCEMFPSDRNGLVFWSHGTGWTPAFTTHPRQKAWGADTNAGYTDQCDITELAAAIPEGVIDYIWFDCCYMASAELLYELTDKTSTVVAYPSEVWNKGMPYDITIPYMIGNDDDLLQAAEKFASYYKVYNQAYSIGVFDLTNPAFIRLPQLFSACVRDMYGTNVYGVQNYGRGTLGPFYDLADLALCSTGSASDPRYLALQDALSECVLFSSCSERSFSGNIWFPERCSGVSVHMPGSGTDEFETFFRSTAWGKAVTTY